jgi:hypothetical protein
MNFIVSDPAMDGEVEGLSFRGLELHLGREPGVLWWQKTSFFFQLNQYQFANGVVVIHLNFKNLQVDRTREKCDIEACYKF